MTNKTCGECRIYDHFHNLCVIGGDIEPTETAKGCFEPKVITNRDKTRQTSNEELAALLGCDCCSERKTKRYVFDCKGCACECRIALKDLLAVPCHCPAQEGRPNWKFVGELERYEEVPESDKKMTNKTCGECKLLFREEHFCGINGAYATIKTAACASFVPFTNGDVIRQGGNRALAEFGAKCMRYSCQCCAFKGAFGDCAKTMDKTCTEGIEAWLNAPADAPDTNVGTKESVGEI